MDHITVKSLSIILLSLGLAFVFNWLFFGGLIGISVFIFVMLLLAIVFGYGYYQQQVTLKKSWWLVLLIGFFALMPAIRANEFLTFLNICATFGLLMLLAHQLVGTPAWMMKLRDYIILMILVPFRMFARAAVTLSQIGQIHSQVKNRDIWVRVVKGVVMAIPILIVFGILFSQADLAFSQFVKSFINIDLSETIRQQLLLVFFAFVAGLCFLSYIFFPKVVGPSALAEKPATPAGQGRGVEILVFLGLIAVLFIVFIGFQITYLFGGETNILHAGFTYAEYARRGFWELLAVALLSLLVLFAAEKYAGVEGKTNKQFLVPALVLIGEVGIVIISAFKRLSLYIDTYGMTTLRFYVAGFIILLLVLFVILAVKFIKSKQEQFFTFGTLLTAASFLILVNVINPDAHIVSFNTKQFERTGKVDLEYIYELSADAVPGEIELYKKLEGEDKRILGAQLLDQKNRINAWKDDWQSANLSRSKALTALEEIE